MRTNTSHQSVSYILFAVTTLGLVFAFGSPSAETAQRGARSARAVQCPFPTVKHYERCVLTKDEVLTTTLRLTSGTNLDCKGLKLSPSKTGSDLANRSLPEAAIFLNDVKSVQIQNCIIEGFDFGIFAINSKVPAAIRQNPAALLRQRNDIVRNTINSRFLAIALATVDNTSIRRNTIRYTSAGGKGIYVGRNSDLNVIFGNTVIGDIAATPATPAVGAPGPVSPTTNPSVAAGQAILVTQTLASDPTVLNAIIEGQLYQLPVVKSKTLNEDFSEDNRVDDNTVTFTQMPFDGIATTVTLRTEVRRNTVSNTLAAIRAGFQSGPPNVGLPKQFPGKCTAPAAGRLCLADADCNILGATGSACTDPAPATVGVFWVADGFIVANNTITGLFQVAVVSTANNTIIQRNRITGPLRPGSQVGAISLIGKFGLGPTTIVTRNRVSNVAVPLVLNSRQFPGLEASTFAARISLNDFTGYTTSVRSDIAATLSVDGQGNFWGLTCPPAFDPEKVERVRGLATTATLTDNRPYGVQVAHRPNSNLPSVCQPRVTGGAGQY